MSSTIIVSIVRNLILRNKTEVSMLLSFPGGSAVKNLPANAGDKRTRVQSLGQEDSLGEGMATHSSILAWRIPWTEEPHMLQSMGFQRVGHD